MSGKDLRELLHAVDDTRELVLRPLPGLDGAWRADELYLAWSAARDDAREAYGGWTLHGGRDAYAASLAAEDRADAALAAVVAETTTA